MTIERGTPVIASVQVGDGRATEDVEDLTLSLASIVHFSALERVGPGKDCRYRALHGADGRAEFEAEMQGLMDPASVALHLAEWDSCTRPIAVVHVTIIEAAQA